jgi:serine phosphatase RsbU (regulator of sigma subunit)
MVSKKDIADDQNMVSRKLVAKILKNAEYFSAGVPQSDDITLLAVRYRPETF